MRHGSPSGRMHQGSTFLSARAGSPPVVAERHSLEVAEGSSPHSPHGATHGASPSARECSNGRAPVGVAAAGLPDVRGANADLAPLHGFRGNVAFRPRPIHFGVALASVRHPLWRSLRTTDRSKEVARPGPFSGPGTDGMGRVAFHPKRLVRNGTEVPGAPLDDARMGRRRSVARLTRWVPWLCVPASRPVCPCRVIVRERRNTTPEPARGKSGCSKPALRSGTSELSRLLTSASDFCHGPVPRRFPASRPARTPRPERVAR